jgi:hypothetical protein
MLSIHPGQNDTANLNDHQQSCLSALTAQITQLNDSMRAAVDSGLTIELHRSARHHQQEGNWGDIIKPTVKAR